MLPEPEPDNLPKDPVIPVPLPAPHKDLPGPQGRPIPLAEYSLQPIKELF